MNWFKNLLRSSGIGLTEQEKDDRALAKRECPDCGSNKLLIGPCGGASMNVACETCLSEFNILNMFGNLRLQSRMGKLTPERAEQAYGLTTNS